MPTIFKLKYGEETRRSTFPELPSWDALSARLSTLYGIPTDKLAVSYTDLDGDDITLNTQGELRDYYETFGEAQLKQVLKLKVINLDSLREGATPRIRMNPDVDDDWHTLPPLQGLSEIYFGKRDMGPDSPHAFVEVIGSDTRSTDWKLPEVEEDKESAVSTIQAHSDKAKAKEALSFPSTVSLLEEESEVKQPIHVMSLSNDNAQDSDHTSQHGQAPSKDENNPPGPSATNLTVDPNTEDPPLPSIDGPSSPSLTEDIALLLSTLSTAVASNPELTNTFRRIAHNTSSGTYWRAHRESLSQTVNTLSESMGTATEEFRRNAEAEAAQNISRALGHIFQSFSPIPVGPVGPDDARPVPPADHDRSTTPPMPGSFRRPRGPWRHSHFRPFWGPHPPPGPPPPPFAGPGPFPNGPPAPPPPPFAVPGSFPNVPRPGPFPNVPPPPPPFTGPGSFPFGPHPPAPPFTGPGLFPFGPHPPPPPPPGAVAPVSTDGPVTVQSEDLGSSTSYPAAPPKGPSRFTDAAGSSSGEPPSTKPDRIWDPSSRPPWLPAPPPIETQTRSTEWSKASPQELRAVVDAAKEQYKTVKEQYRNEREQRKKHKAERREGVGMTPIATTTPIPLSRETSEDNQLPASIERSNSQLVSNARGPFPRLEMVSVPRRSATLPGGKRGSEDFVGRTVLRVSRRLADMGFSETSHPDLPEKIKAQVPHDKVLTKENEDEIVTSLLEGLLAVSPRATTPKTPVASGSGVRENLDVPGGWQ